VWSVSIDIHLQFVYAPSPEKGVLTKQNPYTASLKKEVLIKEDISKHRVLLYNSNNNKIKEYFI